MTKIKRIKIKPYKSARFRGDGSGNLQLSDKDLVPRITVYSYNEKEYIVEKIKDTKALDEHLAKYPELTHWIDVKGLGDPALFEYIGGKFDIHQLVLEDISSNYQRPKLDEYGHYLYGASRMIYINHALEVENEQISFLLLSNILITFQQNYHECLQPIGIRLEAGKGLIRKAGSSYLFYAVLDALIDTYFALIYRLGDELDMIEELLYRRPDKSIMYKIQEIKRVMILIRRAAWPQRDMINDMIRSESKLISKDTRTFLKDVYDHCMQVVDLVESYKDVTTTLIDTNLAIVSNRMNEIMKVLTIISSIFIPLTFIAGVYGMNFADRDPVTGNLMPHNMPELYAPNGYIYTLIVMAVIAVVQVIYFARKGWFK